MLDKLAVWAHSPERQDDSWYSMGTGGIGSRPLCDAVIRLLKERERLLLALKVSYDEDCCWAHDVSGIAHSAMAFAESDSRQPEGSTPK